jgi:hypothetical protein
LAARDAAAQNSRLRGPALPPYPQEAAFPGRCCQAVCCSPPINRIHAPVPHEPNQVKRAGQLLDECTHMRPTRAYSQIPLRCPIHFCAKHEHQLQDESNYGETLELVLGSPLRD